MTVSFFGNMMGTNDSYKVVRGLPGLLLDSQWKTVDAFGESFPRLVNTIAGLVYFTQRGGNPSASSTILLQLANILPVR